MAFDARFSKAFMNYARIHNHLTDGSSEFSEDFNVVFLAL